MKLYGVLTGDLVRSSEISAERLMRTTASLTKMARAFGDLHGGISVKKLEVFRGDSWQWCLTCPEMAIEAAVFLRAGLKADDMDSRIGIGIGPVESIHKSKISQSIGPAFVASGLALDSVTKKRKSGRLGLAFAKEANIPSADSLTHLAIPLLDVQLTRWTSREAVAVYGTLQGLTQQEIADLPISETPEGKPPTRQAIQNALTRIQWQDTLQPALKTFRTVLLEEKESCPNSKKAE